MTDNLLRPPARPCGSCPYRKDVPSGIWDASEYGKLPQYDGETWEQSPKVFMCHQRDGCLCGGWLTTHDPRHLLALRLNPVHSSAFEYRGTHGVACFASGAEACAHGMKDVESPTPEATRKVRGLLKKRGDLKA